MESFEWRGTERNYLNIVEEYQCGHTFNGLYSELPFYLEKDDEVPQEFNLKAYVKQLGYTYSVIHRDSIVEMRSVFCIYCRNKVPVPKVLETTSPFQANLQIGVESFAVKKDGIIQYEKNE